MWRRRGEPGLGELAAAEAAAASFAGTVGYDEHAGVLCFEGLGEVDVTAAFRRAAELEGDARRQYVRGTVRNFLRSSTPLPPAYAGADAELAKRIRTQLEREAKNPTAPVPQEQLGRVERHLGTGDWAARLRRAADGYLAWYRERGDATLLLDAANLYRLVGDTRLGRSLAEEAAAALAPIADDWTEASLNPFAGYRCAALALADDLHRLAGELERRGAAQLGPRWTPIAVAAAAAVRGDRDSLAREVTAWRRLAAAEPVDTNRSSPSDRDLEEMLDEWLRRRRGSRPAPRHRRTAPGLGPLWPPRDHADAGQHVARPEPGRPGVGAGGHRHPHDGVAGRRAVAGRCRGQRPRRRRRHGAGARGDR